MLGVLLLGLVPGVALAQDVDCASAVVQVELNYCADQNFLAADSDLNRAYQYARAMMRQIDANLPAGESGAEAALRGAQRSWISFRDQACLAEAYGWHGGSGQPMIYSGCLARLTAQRAADLWLLAEGY